MEGKYVSQNTCHYHPSDDHYPSDDDVYVFPCISPLCHWHSCGLVVGVENAQMTK